MEGAQQQNPAEKINHLTQAEIHDYLLKIANSGNPEDFQDFKGHKLDLVAFEKALKVLDEILPQSIMKTDRDEGGETNWDRVYRELPALYEINYDFGHELHNLMGQNDWMVSTKSFLTTLFSEYKVNANSDFFREGFLDADSLFGLTERKYFLEFIQNISINKIDTVEKFVSEYGEEGFKTFLSLEHNNNLGNKLIEFGNNTNKDIAHAVFKKYSEIIDASNNVLEYLQQEFSDNTEYSPEILSEISEKLSKEGCLVLEKFVAEADTTKGLVDLEKLQSLLDSIKTDTIAFLSAFKTLKSTNSEFSLSDVQNLDLTTTPFFDIPDVDIKKMEDMYKANYQKYPNLASFLTHKFEESLKQKKGSMSILRRKGDIVAFYRLNPTDKENVLYFGSFNVDPTYQGALLGETLMQESLDAKSENNIVLAECNPQVSVSANYIERGFIGIKKDHIEEIDILRIVRNDKANLKLLSRNVPKEDLMNGTIKDPLVHIYSFPSAKLSSFDFSIVGSKKGNMTEILTRYFKNKENGRTYVVTEDVTEEFLNQYSEPTPN